MQHREETVAIVFDLGPLMTVTRVFHRKRMQAELLLQIVECLGIGLTQRHPDEVVRLAHILLDLLNTDVGHFVAVLVNDAADQHGTPPGGES